MDIHPFFSSKIGYGLSCGLWSLVGCWRIADSALSCGWPANPLQFLWIWAILIASSIINYWWHSSNPPPTTMNVCGVIINKFDRIFDKVGKEFWSGRPGRNVQMRRKERIRRGAPWSEFILTMLAEDLFGSNLSADGWLSQQPLASLQRIVGTEKSRKKSEQADLWKSHTMTDAIRMTETNSWKWPTFGPLWPTEKEAAFDSLSTTLWKIYDIFKEFVFDLTHVR